MISDALTFIAIVVVAFVLVTSVGLLGISIHGLIKEFRK